MVAIPYAAGSLQIPPEAASWPILAPRALAQESGESCLEAALRESAAWALGRTRGTRGCLVVVVPDRTRPLPLDAWLPRLFAAFDEEGVPAGERVIVPASGLHAAMSVAELSASVGPLVLTSGARLAPHDADGESAELGVTPSGIRAALHPALVEADALLALGRVVFHYLAGYGGGRKMVAPGCASRATILELHARCLDADPSRGRHPRARAGILEGNPVHEAACEVAALLPEARAIHAALESSGRCALASFGDLVGDHARIAEKFGSAQRVQVGAPLDALIVSAGGHPLDRDLVQAHKALDAISPLLAPRARVLLVARCGDGAGNPELVEALRLGSSREINRALRRDFRVGTHTALALREKTERFRVSLLGELDDDLLRLAGIERAASIPEWLKLVDAHASGALAPRGASALYSLPGDAAGL